MNDSMGVIIQKFPLFPKAYRSTCQLPTRTIPRRMGSGPDELIYWVVVVLVGSCPRDQMVLVGNSWAYLAFIFIRWKLSTVGSCLITVPIRSRISE